MDLSRHGSPSRPAGPHRPIFSRQARWRNVSAKGRPECELLPLGGKARSAKGARFSPLARDVVIVLAVKAIVLTLLWFAFFRAPIAPHMTMDPGRVAERIAAPGTHPEPANAVR
jgi:hypothetical protein